MGTSVNLPVDAFLRGKGVRRIMVEGLFGEYKYVLETPLNLEGSAPRIFLLYGENGSGKTTILNIVFYLLSHLDKEGHKSRVKRYFFKSVVVECADGTSVSATRPKAAEGSYELSVFKNGKLVASTLYGQTYDDLSVREKLIKEAQHDQEHTQVLTALESLRLRIIFLRHTRKILTNITRSAKEASVFMRHEHRPVPDNHDDEAIQGLNLQSIVFMVNRWTTEQAFRGATRGEEDVNELFSKIISQLAHADKDPDGASSHQGLESLISDLVLQRDRYFSFSAYGLVTPLRLEPLLSALKDLPPRTHRSVIQVLSPYVASLKARLDALEPVRERFATFVDLMNSFYRNKTIRLEVSRGLSIRTRAGETLRIPKLSSGESQLLYLLTNILVAKDQSSIFIVDEPEISLNVKWQRQLLGSLLKLTEDSDIQFVFATHSIELLSRNREFVAKLVSEI